MCRADTILVIEGGRVIKCVESAGSWVPVLREPDITVRIVLARSQLRVEFSFSENAFGVIEFQQFIV